MIVEPFRIHFSNAKLSQLKLQLQASHIARPTFESTHESTARLGVRRDWLVHAKEYWETGFDWRKQEERINELPQFTALIPQVFGEPFKIHFVHQRAATSPETARTVLLLHGWPGSFLEFKDVIKILNEDGGYNIVAPSSPGHAFSQATPLDRPFYDEDVATLMEGLMSGLGYKTYAVQAGDWGSTVARLLAIQSASVQAVHLNFMPFGEAPPSEVHTSLSEEEQKGLERAREFLDNGRGYSAMHRTRPSTIAFAVASSPVALLAWIGEKFLDWSNEDPSLDEILTSVTLYHLTDSFATSIYTYRDPVSESGRPDKWYITQPTGFSSFAKEILPAPQSWAATCCNLKYYKYHAEGGHFAALEKPEELAADLREFLDQVWPVEDLKV